MYVHNYSHTLIKAEALDQPMAKSSYSERLYSCVILCCLPCTCSFNDVLAISQQGLRIRTSSTLNAGGLYFS